MTSGDDYRDKALEFLEMAEGVSEPNFRRELLHIAMEYAALVEQNATTDLVYETSAIAPAIATLDNTPPVPGTRRPPAGALCAGWWRGSGHWGVSFGASTGATRSAAR